MSAAIADLPIPQAAGDAIEEAGGQSQATGYRDVKDVRTIRSLSIVALVQACLLAISFAVIAGELSGRRSR